MRLGWVLLFYGTFRVRVDGPRVSNSFVPFSCMLCKSEAQLCFQTLVESTERAFSLLFPGKDFPFRYTVSDQGRGFLSFVATKRPHATALLCWPHFVRTTRNHRPLFPEDVMGVDSFISTCLSALHHCATHAMHLECYDVVLLHLTSLGLHDARTWFSTTYNPVDRKVHVRPYPLPPPTRLSLALCLSAFAVGEPLCFHRRRYNCVHSQQQLPRALQSDHERGAPHGLQGVPRFCLERQSPLLAPRPKIHL